MKRIMFAISVATLAAGLFVSCEKTPQDNGESGGEKITVSMKADASFAEDNTAKITIELSEASSSDVTVTLAKAAVQDGKKEVPANFSKSVKIEKGKTSAEVKVEADVLGLESGEYQTAIRITAVKGAETPENAVVYITLNYSFKPEVNIYADNAFAGDKTAKIRVALAKATTKDVKVKLAPASDNKYTVTVAPAELTIAAGQTEAEAVATVTLPDDIAIGVYPLVVEIAGVENAVAGKVGKASINLTYPFAVNITIDGTFDDWNDQSIVSYKLPEGTVLYPLLRELRLAANEKYAYMYFEFADPAKTEFYCSSTKEVQKGDALTGNNLPIDIWIDPDASSDTGCFVATTDNDLAYPPYENDKMGLEWYLEGAFFTGNGADDMSFTDFVTNVTVYQYKGEDKKNVWSGGLGSVAGTYTGSDYFGQASFDKDKGVGYAEIQFGRSFFNLKGNKARFAVKIMNQYTNWAAIGLLPQGNATDMKNPESRTQVDMATLILPNYVE